MKFKQFSADTTAPYWDDAAAGQCKVLSRVNLTFFGTSYMYVQITVTGQVIRSYQSTSGVRTTVHPQAAAINQSRSFFFFWPEIRGIESNVHLLYRYPSSHRRIEVEQIQWICHEVYVRHLAHVTGFPVLLAGVTIRSATLFITDSNQRHSQ